MHTKSVLQQKCADASTHAYIHTYHAHTQFHYSLNISIRTLGTHLLEIFDNGTQLSNSPVLVAVVPRDCLGRYGRNSLRMSNEEGECVCSNVAFILGDQCMEAKVVVLAALLPIVAVSGECPMCVHVCMYICICVCVHIHKAVYVQVE
jgi:hypothetical protein